MLGLGLLFSYWQGHLAAQSPSNDPCAVAQLRKSAIDGLRAYSHDGARSLIVKEDEKGISQVYFSDVRTSELRCATCEQKPGGPKPERFKMQPRWHPSGEWFFVAVERDEYTVPPVIGWVPGYREGQLQNGIWTNMYAVSADGERWHRLTDFHSGRQGVADGYTGPAFTSDGKRAVWSQIMDGNILTYWPFGRWELTLADFVVENGAPKFVNHRNITPEGMHWNEPGNFHPTEPVLAISASDQKDAQGMDIYLINIDTRNLTNLTNSPTVWDEHAMFSPDGRRIAFMSAYPYRDDPNASKVLSIKTESMVMDSDGTNLRQITRFLEPGYPETSQGIAANAEWSPDGRSLSLKQLFFPEYEHWDVVFAGPCGRGFGGNLPAPPIRSRTQSRTRQP